MSLFIEQLGDPKKPKLVLVHGWGMHSGVMKPWAETLANQFSVVLVDLPGFGRSPSLAEYSVEGLARSLAKITDDQSALWVGWSLGGVIAMAVANQFPEIVSGVMTLGSNPLFVARDAWPGMEAEVFAAFQQQFAAQPEKTLARFCGLIAQGAPEGRAQLKQLQSMLKTDSGETQAKAQDETLALLSADYRGLFQAPEFPAMFGFAENDALVPSQVSTLIGENSFVIEGVGHAPFLSQSEPLAHRIKAFADDIGVFHG